MLVSLTARSLAELDVNVTLPQYRALVILAGSGPRRIVDLAADLNVQPSTATRMCDRLARKGLVEREAQAGDRRVVCVVLRDAGRELVGTMMERRRAYLADLVASVELRDPSVVAALIDAMQALASAAGEMPEADWQAHWDAEAPTP
jgi:DNA-binding MarR family transcriptional regulator